MVELSQKSKDFVEHFGQMGSRWGFNRTVAQLLGLLIIIEKPLCADQIAQALSISRGNVSMGIKELQSWQLLKTDRVPGDRKDYYSTVGDFWDMAKAVLQERRKRELDPTLSMLRNHIMAEDNGIEDPAVYDKMKELYELLELLSQLTDCLDTITPSQMRHALKLGLNLNKLLSFKDELFTSSAGS